VSGSVPEYVFLRRGDGGRADRAIEENTTGMAGTTACGSSSGWLCCNVSGFRRKAFRGIDRALTEMAI
jgi:hypothetical protein